MCYCPKKRCSLRRNCADWTTTAYSPYTNWSIKILIKIFLYPWISCFMKCTCEGYYIFGAVKGNDFSCTTGNVVMWSLLVYIVFFYIKSNLWLVLTAFWYSTVPLFLYSTPLFLFQCGKRVPIDSRKQMERVLWSHFANTERPFLSALLYSK